MFEFVVNDVISSSGDIKKKINKIKYKRSLILSIS